LNRLALLVTAALLLSCSPSPPERRTESMFQSVCSITLYDHATDEVFAACFERLRGLDAMLSMWKTDSALSRLNAAAGTGPVKVPPELAENLRRGLELAELSGGRYDPTVGPLVKLWGVGTNYQRVPAASEIRDALALLDRRGIILDSAAGTVALPRAGMSIDFGSQAKGYSAREAGRILASRGVRSALVDLGGCVLALGSHPSGKAWKIGVQDPFAARGERGERAARDARIIGYFLARESLVSTSGIYERFFRADGKTWHHIMDTTTGYPVENGLVSATVLLDREENADGPCLAALALGAGEGIAFADRLGAAAVLLDREKRVYLSAAAKENFVLTDASWSVAR